MARRSRVQREKDLETIAQRYLRGDSQYFIALDLDVTQQTVSNDLKELQRRWRESSLVNIDEAKAKELAKIDQLEREYWQAWEDSRGEKATTTAKQSGGDKQVSIRKEDQSGDPRYLQGVQWCIERRCKVMGLDAPARSEITGRDGGPIEAVLFEQLSDADLDALADIAGRIQSDTP